MPMRWAPLLARLGAVAVVASAIAGCTPGGQFDPTVLLSNNVFDTKKSLKGTREPVFPNGVPGIETGVPPDLVKGYQPPPEQADNADASAAPAAAEAEKPKPKLRPKPRPAVARAPAPSSSSRISIGPAGKPAALKQESTVQSMWPTPEPQQTAAPPQAAGSSSMWPAPPSAAPSQPSARPAQSSQPSQSVWPSPPSAPPPSQ
jgi:hypothetical protein